MFEINRFLNERCEVTMQRMVESSMLVDLVLTSPPYNTNKKQGKSLTIERSKTSLSKSFNTIRYDTAVDVISNEQYIQWMVSLFGQFYRIVKDDGVVLYNLSYGNDNSTGMIQTVSSVISDTGWTLADIIAWKKPTAMPNNQSPNRLTRYTEFIYVFCKKGHEKTFHANKEVKSQRESGQKMYTSIPNFIEAPNNDCTCPFNKATFSSILVLRLLQIYGVLGGIVYDPFMGSGSTAVGALKYGMNFIGSEISENQCAFARDRIDKMTAQSD